MMTGAISVLNEAGCALVGGHTGEGKELALGFAINGLIDETCTGDAQGRHAPRRRADPDQTDRHRHLFAAHARLQARGRWIDAALESMQWCPTGGARILPDRARRHRLHRPDRLWLLGHLVEMTRPRAWMPNWNSPPCPCSTAPVGEPPTCVPRASISSLQPANVRLRRALRNQAEADL
jgi:selenide,water dikinase